MKKNFIIVILVIVAIMTSISTKQMTSRATYWMKRSEAADRYIEELERDFPAFIDITAEGDAYSEYYEYK